MPIETDEQDSFVIADTSISDYPKALEEWIETKGADILRSEFLFNSPIFLKDKDLMRLGIYLKDSFQEYWNSYNEKTPVD